MSEEGLISKYMKNSTIQHPNIKKTKDQKMGKELEHFSKKDIQMANKYIKRRSIIRDMKIKTTIR